MMQSSEIYQTLFFDSFFAALVIPFRAEMAFKALVNFGSHPLNHIIFASLIAFICGSFLNWILGRITTHLIEKDKKIIEGIESKLEKTKLFVSRYGLIIIILLSWVPIVGTSATYLAGVVKMRWWMFIIGVSISKVAHYIIYLSS